MKSYFLSANKFWCSSLRACLLTRNKIVMILIFEASSSIMISRAFNKFTVKLHFSLNFNYFMNCLGWNTYYFDTWTKKKFNYYIKLIEHNFVFYLWFPCKIHYFLILLPHAKLIREITPINISFIGKHLKSSFKEKVPCLSSYHLLIDY